MSLDETQAFLQFTEEFGQNLLSERPSDQIRRWQKEGLLKKYLPELDKCVDVNQDPKYHKDTVFDHCLKTCDNTPKDLAMRWAGLLHDIGKAKTRDYHILCGLKAPQKISVEDCEHFKRKCGADCKHAVERITFYKHEIASEQLARQVLERFAISVRTYTRAINLVKFHMYNYVRRAKLYL